MRIAPDDQNRNEVIQEKIWAMHYSLKKEFFNICFDRFTASQAVNHFMLLVQKEIYPNSQPPEDFGMGRYNIRKALKDNPQIAEIIIKKAEDAADELIKEIKDDKETRLRTILFSAYYLAASWVVNFQNFWGRANQDQARARIKTTKKRDKKTDITKEYFMNISS